MTAPTAFGVAEDTTSADDLSVGQTHIQRLAPELLGEIFQYCVPSPTEPISYRVAPLLLLHVSHYWRDVTKGTPSLWQDAHIGRGFTLDPCLIFHMWLDYSASLPLKVTLHINKPKDPAQEMRILDIILDNLHRISKLEGQLPHNFASYLYQRRDKSPWHAPLLREISVGGWDKLPNWDKLQERDVALRHLKGSFITPQLEILDLQGARYQLSLLNFNPASLRALHGLYVMEVAKVVSMNILSTFTNLQKLSFLLYGVPDPEELQIPDRIYIPTLKYLMVATFPGYDPHRFLGALYVPSIEHLEIGSSPQGQVSVGPLLTAFTQNNNISQIKKLTLFGYITEAKEHLPWLTKFSNLQVLEFRHCVVDVTTIALLTTEPSTPSELWLCPMLSKVSYEQSEIPWAAVIKFVESRCSNGNITTPEGVLLSEVKFDSCEGLTNEQRGQLLQLRDGSSGTLHVIIKDKELNEKEKQFYRN